MTALGRAANLRAILVAAAFVAVLAAAAASRSAPSADARAVTAGAQPLPAPRLASPAAAPPRFDHVVLVMFENRSLDSVLGYRGAPTFNRLAARYAVLRNYRAVTHPSLPNYLALVSGSTQGIHSDCVSCASHARSLADTLRAAGLTWRTYVEGLTSSRSRLLHPHQFYARIPFLHFASVRGSEHREQQIQPLLRFGRDLRAGTLPRFSLVVPSLCHDMHGCSVSIGDRWLRGFMRPLLRSRSMRRSVVFLVFDESEFVERSGGGGRVPAIVVGPLVCSRSHSNRPLDHYSLLRTIEDAWHLPRLGHSARARPITQIWRTGSCHSTSRMGSPGPAGVARDGTTAPVQTGSRAPVATIRLREQTRAPGRGHRRRVERRA